MKKILIGFIAGMICGLFSSGGGLILVPAFTNLLKLNEKKARGTAIASILPMVIISSLFYYKANYIDWKLSINCAIGGIIGAMFGAKLLNKMDTKKIRFVFTIFLFYVGIKILVS